MRRLLIAATTIFSLLASPALACKVLEDIDNMTDMMNTDKVQRERIIECMERGEDPRFEIRPAMGEGIKNTGAGNITTTNLCGPDLEKACKNSLLRYTDPKELVGGYDPAKREELSVEIMPWEEEAEEGKLHVLPCGAMANVGKMAFDAVSKGLVRPGGRPNFQADPGSIMTDFMTDLAGSFMSWLGCQLGVYFGQLDDMLMLPKISGSIPLYNGAFEIPHGTSLALSSNRSLQVDYLGGTSDLGLPAGGTFPTATGQTASVPPGGRLVASPSGAEVYNQGGDLVGSYALNPDAPLTLNPNGFLAVPEGTIMPIPDNGELTPPRPYNRPPAWAQ